MSFADPRDGDIEDDASSTARHTLLRHAGTTLLELSLAKLALSLVLLIILPGVLLGGAPILAVLFVQKVWRTMPDAAHLLSLLLVLAVAGAIAWRWGPALFRIAERNFWALSAALVQPLAMAVREMLRQLLETAVRRRLLHGGTAALARIRRRTGLLAGVVIAACGALVILAAGPWPRFFVYGLDTPAGLLRAMQDALANGVLCVGLELLLAGPAWAIAEALTGTPEDMTPDGDPRRASWRVAHLSDIHLVGERHGFRLECGRDGPRGNERVEHALARLEAADAARRLDWILVTGDITDAGRNAEWIAFEESLAAHPGLRDRVLILPGNHDVNIVDRANPARLELPTSPGGAVRRLRFLAACAALQGGRVHVVDRRRRRLGPTLEAYLAAEGRGGSLARFLDAGRRPRGAPAPGDAWEAAFPLIVPPERADGLGVVLFDSNAQTHFSFTNALGILPVAELRAAEAVFAQFPAARWLVCLHHHLMEYPRPGASLAERVGTALVNGHWVVGRLRREGRRLVVLHGHRHTDWMGQVGGLRILSAPSPVMGPAGSDTTRHFWIHHLAPAADGSLALLAPERVVVPGVIAAMPDRAATPSPVPS
jgi:hypothetical protein